MITKTIKILNNLKIRTHMMISIGTVAFLAFAVTIVFVSVRTGRVVKGESMDKVRVTAYQYSNIVTAQLQVPMDTARTLSQTMEGLIKQREAINRDAIDEILKQLLLSNDMFSGIWCVFEPNMLDGKDKEFANHKWHDQTGTYFPYFFKKDGRVNASNNSDYKTADYYQIPKKNGIETLLEPYIEKETGNTLMTSVCVPVKENGRIIGVVGVDIFLKTLQKLVSGIKIYETGYLSIISNDSIYLAHPDAKRIGNSILKTDKWAEPYKEAIRSGKGFNTTIFSKTAGEAIERICVPIQIGHAKTPWAVLANIPTNRVMASANSIMYTTVMIGALSLLTLMAVIILITRSITTPLIKGVDFAQKMSDGDFTQKLAIDQKDEIGNLANALNSMTSNIGSIFRDVKGGVKTLHSSSSELSAISQQMADGSEEASRKSDEVNNAAQDMNANMNSIAASSEQAMTNLNLVAAATEEMTSTINEIAENTENARGITGNAVEQARNASGRVNELGKAARQIGKVTEVITEISEQTNLLALNATIEAARAGNAGKGFAVVAGEIKDLAKQTAGATNDIKKEIENIRTTISVTVEEIKQISNVNDEVNEIVSSIATAVEEQSVTTKEVAENIAQASMGFNEVNENVVQSAAATQGITKDISEINLAAGEISDSGSQVMLSAGQLLQLAQQLNETVNMFKV